MTWNTIPVYGGCGYIDEYPVERYFQDARTMTIVEDTSQIHRPNIGRKALGISAFV